MCAMLQPAEHDVVDRKQLVNGAPATAVSQQLDPRSRKVQVLSKARHHADAGRYKEAIDLLKTLAADSAATNDKGVCLMRMGCYQDAVHVLRNLVLHPGSTWMRKELPLTYKVNFATSLALGGFAEGCREILSEINNDSHPAVAKLRDAIAQWKSSLTFWQRVNSFMGVDAAKPIKLNYLPGEFSELSG